MEQMQTARPLFLQMADSMTNAQWLSALMRIDPAQGVIEDRQYNTPFGSATPAATEAQYC